MQKNDTACMKISYRSVAVTQLQEQGRAGFVSPCIQIKERNRLMIRGRVYINEQEENGNFTFTGIRQYMTCGFQNAFGEEAGAVAFTALALILEKYPDHADYLQTFEYFRESGERRSFWCINDVDVITFLLPEEY